MINLSFLIPVYNSEKTIAQLCEHLIDEFASKTGLEIVLVNDCSKDNSSEVCKKLNNDHPDIVSYLELSRNFGEHNALMAGFSSVTGDYCVCMDDDLQNPPEEVWKLVNEMMKGYDVVYSHYSSKKDPFYRNVASRFNDRMARFILNKPVDLYLSSFKIINRFLINEIIKYDGPDPYIDGIILRSTRRISVVEVEHSPRKHGDSGYTIKKLLSLWGSMMLNFSIIPLRIIGIFGLSISLWALAYAGHRIFFDRPYGELTEHQSSMVLIIFLFGIMFLCIALVAEYIGRIFLNMNKDPQYILREKLLRNKSK